METGPGATTAAKCIRQLSTGKNPPLECRGFYTRHVCRAQIHLRHHHLQKSESASDSEREQDQLFQAFGPFKKISLQHITEKIETLDEEYISAEQLVLVARHKHGGLHNIISCFVCHQYLQVTRSHVEHFCSQFCRASVRHGQHDIK